MKTTLGTCSVCGGPVTVPTAWWGLFPPTPCCENCGAVPEAAHGPIIPMRPTKTWTTSGTNWNLDLNQPFAQ